MVLSFAGDHSAFALASAPEAPALGAPWLAALAVSPLSVALPLRWISADLSKSCSGVAIWEGAQLVDTATVRPDGRTGRYIASGVVHGSEIDAWRAVLSGAGALVHEAGLGHRSAVTQALAAHRGLVLAVWQMVGGGPVRSVSVQTWRKVARQTWGLPFPAHSAGCKELAVWLVRRHWGLAVGHDEADAVLVGHWALRTRALEVELDGERMVRVARRRA